MNETTLERNKVSQFILRIDLPQNTQVDIRQLALDLQGEYVRFVENIEHNLNINIENNNVNQIEEREFTNYSLIADNGIQLSLNTHQKFILFESNSYVDNSVYTERLKSIIEKINAQGKEEVMSSRIGMRFINVFPCDKKENIKKILQKPNDKAISASLEKSNLNRTVLVEQYNFDSYFVRVQYGVFNKFYPSVIKNTDITLDIDVYYGGLTHIAEWDEVIKCYNHVAYKMFETYVEPTYIESMR